MMSFNGSAAMLHIHFLFGGVVALGLVLLLVWLYKHASKEQLMTWVWGTLVVGALGVLLTAPFGLNAWRVMMPGGFCGGLNGGGAGISTMADFMEGKFKEGGVPFDRNLMMQQMREYMFGASK
mgnify:CR=1 FL=1